jgi:hypothetical protein
MPDTSSQLDDTLPAQGRAAWHNASQEAKEDALRDATQFIETLPFKGERLTENQALAWPRKGVFRDDGAPVTGIPIEIEQTTSLVASFILAKIPFNAPAAAWVWFTLGHLIQDDGGLMDRDITWH